MSKESTKLIRDIKLKLLSASQNLQEILDDKIPQDFQKGHEHLADWNSHFRDIPKNLIYYVKALRIFYYHASPYLPHPLINRKAYCTRNPYFSFVNLGAWPFFNCSFFMCRANDNETFSDPLQPFHVYFQLAPSRLNGYFFSTLRRYKNLNNTVATRGKVLHAAVHSLQSFDKSLDQVSMGRRKRQRKKIIIRSERKFRVTKCGKCWKHFQLRSFHVLIRLCSH